MTSTIVVQRGLADVWSFVIDPANAPKWDRSVARTRVAFTLERSSLFRGAALPAPRAR